MMQEIFDISNEDMVSIVMPCYNAQAFVGEAIASVVNQTWRNWELIIINDGSQDQSVQIIQEWSEEDSRIIPLINDQNLGVSKTRNRGISLAKGQWIAFLDSDDVWKEDKLEKQILLAREKRASFIFTSCNIINQNGKFLGSMTALPSEVTFSQLQKWNCVTCSSVLINKKGLGDLRFEHDDSREDYLLWLRILKNLKLAHALREPLVYYRVISGSRSANKLKMTRDTYRVHRHLGTNIVKAAFYTLTHFCYAFLNKNRNIRN